MTKSPWFSSSPPISRCSCTLVRRKHSQYTGENYFWHSKVTAERQALNLRAAFKKKQKTARTPVYMYSVHLCVLFSKRTRRDFCAESRTVLPPPLFLKRQPQWRAKQGCFPARLFLQSRLNRYLDAKIGMISTYFCIIWDSLAMYLRYLRENLRVWAALQKQTESRNRLALIII